LQSAQIAESGVLTLAGIMVDQRATRLRQVAAKLDGEAG
jgi:hypothetical protein